MFLKSNKRKPETDLELVSRYRHSLETSYIGELFQRYTHLVFGVSMKYLKNEEDAKDAVMEIFEKIIVELKKHEVENFEAWLYFVVKNQCLMKLRKQKTISAQRSGYENFVQEIVEFEEPLHLNSKSNLEELETSLKNGMNYLKEEQRHCVELFYFGDKSYKEIADVTGYSMKQVKTFLQNGKRNLKVYLRNTYGHK